MGGKIEQNKGQYKTDRKTAKILALSSGNVGKYEFLTSEDVLPEKELLEKVAEGKPFEYSPFGKAFERQTDIIKKWTEFIKKKEGNRYKLLKTITGKDKKCCDKVTNALLCLPKEQVEKNVEIDKT